MSRRRPDETGLSVAWRWDPLTTADDVSDVLPAPLLLTVPEAARLLAVGRTSVYQLVWDGEITPVRIGRSVRFTLAELERFVNERAPASPPDAQAIA